MTEFTGADEVQDRLNLIESMVLEGRRGTERWGWAFVLWGAAYMVAFGWSVAAPRFGGAWPITMLAAVVLSGVIRRARGSRGAPRTTVSRSVASVWIAFGIAAFLLFFALGFSRRMTDIHVFFATLAAMVGMANGASAMILRWKPQMACAVVWWAAAAVSCFEAPVAFLAAVFLCQIVFGAYLMYLESRETQVQARGIRGHA